MRGPGVGRRAAACATTWWRSCATSRRGSGVPYTILVSNWSQMTEEKYLALREAGVDQFSVSLDFPDERHDDFRGYPGLYGHLARPRAAAGAHGYDDIVLNTCITSENVGEIDGLADKAREWGVNICYSSYSARRTGCRDYSLTTPEQLAALNRELERWRRAATAPTGSSTRPPRSHATRRYFENGGMPGCKAGHPLPGGHQRWLAAALLHAVFQRYRLEEHARMVGEFTPTNTCDECYVSIRSYLDKSFPAIAVGKRERVLFGEGAVTRLN